MISMESMIDRLPAFRRNTRRDFFIKVGEMSDGAPIALPVIFLNGEEEHPKLCLVSVLHGDEVGVIDILTGVCNSVNVKQLRGSIIAIPVANPPSFWGKIRWSPLDYMNLNRIWPGNPSGWISERIAHTIFNEIILGTNVDCVIDYHSGGMQFESFPHLDIADTKSWTKARELAEAFGLDIHVKMGRQLEKTEETLRATGALDIKLGEQGVAAIRVEIVGTLHADDEVDLGIKSTVNVMKHYKMIDGKEGKMGKCELYSRVFVRADCGGMLKSKLRLGEAVMKGGTLGVIQNVFGKRVCEVKSPANGRIILMRVYPVVQTGDEAYIIATPLPASPRLR